MAAPILPDLLHPNLRLVVCGSAAGEVSKRRGAYYAGPGNRFYRILAEVGLTDRVLLPEQYPELLSYGIGLTDVAKRHFGVDRLIPRSACNGAGVQEKVRRFQPRVLAFNGKNAAKRTLGLDHVPYGLLAACIGMAQLFVCPSTSGAARAFWDASIWHDLADFVKAHD